jgi:hypothetical protein
MASVLAIVSKAVFEKRAPKDVDLGAVIGLDRYVSSHKAFEAVAGGGAVFMVTVRPPDEKLWLVAILENPKRKDDAWVAVANTAPLVDITTAIAKLQFTTGAGLHAKKGALGMSLQTPRGLTDEDVALLRSYVLGAPVSAGDAYKAAVDQVVHRSSGNARLGKFRLENKRAPFAGKLEDLKDYEKLQLKAVLGEGVDLASMFAPAAGKQQRDEEGDEMAAIEIADVVDTKTGDVLYELMIWPYGDGAVVHHATTKMAASICQHGVDPANGHGKIWMRDFARAWVEGSARLQMWTGHIDFGAETLADEVDDD